MAAASAEAAESAIGEGLWGSVIAAQQSNDKHVYSLCVFSAGRETESSPVSIL